MSNSDQADSRPECALRPERDGETRGFVEAPIGAIALQIVSLWRESDEGGLVYLVGSERRAEQLGALLFAIEPNSNPLVLPAWGALPNDPTPPSREIAGRRASVLSRLAQGLIKPLLAMTAEAALLRLPQPAAWRSAAMPLAVGSSVSEDELRAFLERTGYAIEPHVQGACEASFAGSAADVFPAGALGPLRLTWENGFLSSIRAYDLESQRTTVELRDIAIAPASELNIPGRCESSVADAQDRGSHFFEYASKAQIFSERAAVDRAALWLQQVALARESVTLGSGLSQSSGGGRRRAQYVSIEEFNEAARGRIQPAPAGERHASIPRFATQSAPRRALRIFLDGQLATGSRVALTAVGETDLKALERSAAQASGSRAKRLPSWSDFVEQKPGLYAVQIDFDGGFALPSRGICVIAAADILGSRASHDAPLGWREQKFAEGWNALRPGDLVIHLGRGLGRLNGLEALSTEEELQEERIKVEYAEGAAVLFPVDELAFIWKYGSGEGLRLDRADGSSWLKRRDTLEQEIRAAAAELEEAKLKRQTATAPKLVAPRTEYERFVAQFPFVLTPDQASAAEDVLADLASGKPMDRLVFGDVGFGKTEIALRAAAAALFSGKTVALAAPTSVLARQHFETFKRRFDGFGIEMGQLSRLTPKAEALRVKKGMADGSIQLAIGTQSIAGKGISFRDLGLLIVDEEQKFGAREKEKFRSMAAGAHLLTLTATPIPRTLQLALANIRDASVLSSPPARRLPVRTASAVMDLELLRAALMYERRRDGQSFVVCPRIEDLGMWDERLEKAAPELRRRILHGKMSAEEIDVALLAFASGDGDILLATNIIESGLDVPRANTIIVSRPDRFGIAQLHQLRGRVGRGVQQGFAYLLFEAGVEPTAASRKRARILQELDQLGAGFAISQRDFDLRGGGDLLGDKQAGHLKLVGPALYRHLLKRAMRKSRNDPLFDEELPELNLGIHGRIPATYVVDDEMRLELYSRLVKAESETSLNEIAAEIEDRFGPLPEQMDFLIFRLRLKQLCKRLGICRVDAGPEAVAISFSEVDHAQNIYGEKAGWRWSGGRLLREHRSEPPDRLRTITEILDLIES